MDGARETADPSLSGRTAVVTGAGRNIGAAIARRLATDGFAVAVLDIDVALAERTARAIVEELGARALPVKVDVRVEAEVLAAVRAVLEWAGRIDVLVNNAAIPSGRPLMELDEAAWDRTIDTNLKGTFLCMRAVVPHMAAAGGGRIVNLSSVASLGYAGHFDYSASKGGVDALTVTAALELGPRGITVNCVAPGPVARDAAAGGIDPRIQQPYIDQTPLGRLATSRDVAAAVAYLCSEDASFLTGQRIQVCGGRNVGYWGGFGKT